MLSAQSCKGFLGSVEINLNKAGLGLLFRAHHFNVGPERHGQETYAGSPSRLMGTGRNSWWGAPETQVRAWTEAQPVTQGIPLIATAKAPPELKKTQGSQPALKFFILCCRHCAVLTRISSQQLLPKTLQLVGDWMGIGAGAQQWVKHSTPGINHFK